MSADTNKEYVVVHSGLTAGESAYHAFYQCKAKSPAEAAEKMKKSYRKSDLVAVYERVQP